MKIRLLLLATVMCLASHVLAQNIVAVDEWFNGIGTTGNGTLKNDPGPGGLNNVLTYALPFAGVPGDVQIQANEPGIGQIVFDVVRFNGDGTLIFYSDNVPISDAPGDTPGPPGILYANSVTIQEVGTEGANGSIYAPAPGQPGYDSTNPIYFLISEGNISTTPFAGIFGAYQLNYFSNANTTGAPDAALRLVNTGFLSDASPVGDLCASVYVFDSTEQLNECCSCRVTPNGLLTLSVNKNLTGNTLTGGHPTRGVVKLLSSQPVGGVCDPKVQSAFPGIQGWISHVQSNSPGAKSFAITEEELLHSLLGAGEAADLAEDCTALIELGSGSGVCSCSDSGQ